MGSDMRLWDAHLICEREGKNLRVKLKDGNVYEGEVEDYSVGLAVYNEQDDFILAGPKGTNLRRCGGTGIVMRICESEIAEIEIIDRE